MLLQLFRQFHKFEMTTLSTIIPPKSIETTDFLFSVENMNEMKMNFVTANSSGNFEKKVPQGRQKTSFVVNHSLLLF